jgi:F-type H+-transporting ATPase subunit epsilon
MFKTHVVHISDKVLHDGEVERVLLPGVIGEFEVVDHHAPIVSLLCRGPIVICGQDREPKTIIIDQGLMRFDGYQLFAVVE